MSDNANNIPANEPKVKVANGKLDKPKFGQKVVNFLFSDKIDSVMGYLAYCILGPSLKDLIFKMGTGALQMALYGGGNVQNTGSYIPGYGYQTARRDVPAPYNYSMAPNQGYAQPQMPAGYYPQRVSLNDISFDTKDDAYVVLDRMRREIGRYGKVKIADFYTFAGITGQESNWTLQGTGWYNLDNVIAIMRMDGRWIIDFPPPVSLR